jgi:hypothetical protein
MDDKSILEHINELVDEEHRLLAAATPQDDRLKHVSEQLDQCWDLLRQRRAKREFGQNPDAAHERDAKTVETYKG